MTKFTKVIQSRRQSRLRKPGLRDKFKIDREKIGLAVFLALIISGFAYLALINSVSTRGFEIKSLEKKVESLRKENERLQMEAVELQSMNTIAAASKKLSLEPVEKVEYVSTGYSSVAWRE